MIEDIQKRFAEAAGLIEQFGRDGADTVARAAEMIVEACASGGCVLIFGNGGSAADAQHIAGEFVGRFYLERKAFKAVALSTDTSVLTAVGNDYGYDRVFARQIEALGGEGDVALALSTSGNSPNVVEGLKQARRIGMHTIAFTGQDGGKCRELADVLIAAPARQSPRVQEVHEVAYHVLCEMVEREMVQRATRLDG
jgi:D-sedoheptulose 7-phosphate isomerase